MGKFVSFFYHLLMSFRKHFLPVLIGNVESELKPVDEEGPVHRCTVVERGGGDRNQTGNRARGSGAGATRSMGRGVLLDHFRQISLCTSILETETIGP